MAVNRYWLITALLAMSLFGQPTAIADNHQPASIDATITFFYYENLGEAAAFYGDLLGLEKMMDEDWVKIYRITDTSSVGLVLEGKGYHSVSADKPAMLSIVTDNVDAWYQLLLESKVTLQTKLKPEDQESDPDGAPVRGFVAEDPGGYTVEFFSWQDQK